MNTVLNAHMTLALAKFAFLVQEDPACDDYHTDQARDMIQFIAATYSIDLQGSEAVQ